MDVNAFHMKSEDTDLFKEHFGNLSAILKVERRQSSTRRRYSSQYFVRRDYFVGCKNFFDKSMQNIGVKESATNVTLDDPVIHEKQVMGSINQDLNSNRFVFLFFLEMKRIKTIHQPLKKP